MVLEGFSADPVLKTVARFQQFYMCIPEGVRQPLTPTGRFGRQFHCFNLFYVSISESIRKYLKAEKTTLDVSPTFLSCFTWIFRRAFGNICRLKANLDDCFMFWSCFVWVFRKHLMAKSWFGRHLHCFYWLCGPSASLHGLSVTILSGRPLKIITDAITAQAGEAWPLSITYVQGY